jgi:acetyl-CoA C-acetyltransferase/acetyl-CoA acyltransferase
MKTERFYIVDGIRTPFAKAQTSLAAMQAPDLARDVIAALLARTGIDPGAIDEVILGCVGQPSDSMNIARVAALRAGIPTHVPAITVHRNCASGCEAITSAKDRFEAGHGDLFVVGGVESMSNYPLQYPRKAAAKFAALQRAKSLPARLNAIAQFRPSDFVPVPALLQGLSDPVSGLNMGETAELLAREWTISRQEQDEFALQSHSRANAARERIVGEIVTVYPPKRAAVEVDNGIREDASIERLARLKPIFDRNDGTVTAGNSSQITDGAVALLVAGEKTVERLDLVPIGVLTAHAYAGCDPARMGLGPLHAIHAAEKGGGPRLEEAELVEINEAFAAQILAVLKAAESRGFAKRALDREAPLGAIDRSILNVNGGAIALGHPVGATGARLVLTMLREMNRRSLSRGLVSLCVGGGQGAALWLEKP